jgi:inositol 2-dehydrogenase
MTLGVGVIGTGVMGRRHAENIAALWPRARLVAVADAFTQNARAVADELACDWYQDADELLARPDIQAVVIATGADTHARYTMAAAERGKDILCEKPLALTLADAERAAQAAEQARVRLQIGFMRRYDPPYRDAYEAIERGEIGRPVLFSAISRDALPPPRSYFSSPGAGGLFIDSGIHDLDLARWLMRDEVQTIVASGAVVACHDLADVQPLDAGAITLHFRQGAMGTIQLYRRAVYGYDIRTEVLGTEGAVMVGDHRWKPTTVLRHSEIVHTMPHHWLERFAEAYALEMADWVDRMAHDRPPAVTAEDGIKSVALALAAEESAKTGRAIALPGERAVPGRS